MAGSEKPNSKQSRKLNMNDHGKVGRLYYSKEI